VGELGTTQSMNDRRLEKFVNQVRDICRSPKSFNPIRELKHQNIGIRIVVREGSAKHLVVTIHPLGSSPADLMSLPEVPHDIW